MSAYGSYYFLSVSTRKRSGEGSLIYLQVNALAASELSGFTCTSSLTMNEKFQYRTRPPSAVLKNFEFNVSERVNECVNLFIIQIEYTASKTRQILSQPKPRCNDSGV